MHTTLFKIGGSLFDLPDLGARLQCVLNELSGTRPILVSGGGATADLVRRWQPQFHLSDDVAHWLAVDALDFHAQLVTALIPHSIVVHTVSDATTAWRRELVPIIAPGAALREWDVAFPDDAPPHVWDVTSDSLATWIALRWPCDELVLLKSVPAPVGHPATAASAAGWVDPYFSGLAGRLARVSWCCLREPHPQIDAWLINGVPAC